MNSIFEPTAVEFNKRVVFQSEFTEAMGEDVGAGLLAGSNTTSGVPIEHLDYGYVRECKNSKELEKILKVLR